MADDNKWQWQLVPLCFSTTDYMHSSTPYHPHGAPIFPIRQTQQLFPEETSCNFNLLRLALQAICAPPRHTTPVGLPSFPNRQQRKHTNRGIVAKQESKLRHIVVSRGNQTMVGQILLHPPFPISTWWLSHFQGSKASKSGSDEAESEV